MSWNRGGDDYCGLLWSKTVKEKKRMEKEKRKKERKKERFLDRQGNWTVES